MTLKHVSIVDSEQDIDVDSEFYKAKKRALPRSLSTFKGKIRQNWGGNTSKMACF